MPTNLKLTIFFLFTTLSAFTQSIYVADIKQPSILLFNSFSKMQSISGKLSFTDTARIQWNNLPVGLRSRAGASIGNMTDEQRILLHRILSVSLSSQGYLKATGIMHLDDLLDRYADSMFYRKEVNDTTYKFLKDLLWSHKNYYFAFFGNPNDAVWGFKLEGHHLSVNFTFVNGRMSAAPLS